jgi:hypothetical protein
MLLMRWRWHLGRSTQNLQRFLSREVSIRWLALSDDPKTFRLKSNLYSADFSPILVVTICSGHSMKSAWQTSTKCCRLDKEWCEEMPVSKARGISACPIRTSGTEKKTKWNSLLLAQVQLMTMNSVFISSWHSMKSEFVDGQPVLVILQKIGTKVDSILTAIEAETKRIGIIP